MADISPFPKENMLGGSMSVLEDSSAKVSATSKGSCNPIQGNIAGISTDPVLRIRTYPNISGTGSG